MWSCLLIPGDRSSERSQRPADAFDRDTGSGQLLPDGYGRSIGTLTALPYSVHEPS
jgi:hypothetical protein